MVLPTGVGVRSSLGLACSKDLASSRATDLRIFPVCWARSGGARARRSRQKTHAETKCRHALSLNEE